MFTSRAEHRLILREDNASERLYDIAQKKGLLSPERQGKQASFLNQKKDVLKQLNETQIVPNEETQNRLKSLNTNPLLKPQKLAEVLRRPEIKIKDLEMFLDAPMPEEEEVCSSAEIEIKYEGYIKKQKELVKSLEKMENFKLINIDYEKVRGLSIEDREKLSFIQPATLGQATRISGVKPTAIQALFIHLKTKQTSPSLSLN